MIRPVIGRTVYFSGHSMYGGSQEHPAVITKILSDTCVNLTVFFDDDVSSPMGPVEYRDRPSQIGEGFGWRWPPRSVNNDDALEIIQVS